MPIYHHFIIFIRSQSSPIIPPPLSASLLALLQEPFGLVNCCCLSFLTVALTLSSPFSAVSLSFTLGASSKIFAASCCNESSVAQPSVGMEPSLINLMFSRSHPSFLSHLLFLPLDAFSARFPFVPVGKGKMLTMAVLAFLDEVLLSCCPPLI